MNIIINKNYINQRLDNYCFKFFKQYSKNDIYKYIRESNIKVNNEKRKFFYKLQENDVININFNFNIIEKKITKKNLLLIFLLKKRILYEDNYLIILNKPCGFSIHNGSKNFINIIDSLKFLCKNKFIELNHRLDKDTSGILIFSKNRLILCDLNNQFKNKLILKKYLVLVHGNLLKNKLISLIINKNQKNDIYNSKTFFTIIKNYKYYSLLEAISYTGKTHQIRIHLAYYGFPVVGDIIYGDVKKNQKCILKRLFLHANYISFFHPIFKKKIDIICKLDNDLLNFLNKLD